MTRKRKQREEARRKRRQREGSEEEEEEAKGEDEGRDPDARRAKGGDEARAEGARRISTCLIVIRPTEGRYRLQFGLMRVEFPFVLRLRFCHSLSFSVVPGERR